ncbi:hypothetical protein [Bacteroides fragilis]|uniref:hypothetical protein n=1 Tax=Bacteroides fragilis TaxID=817 RepID=UPI001E3E9357|nr:hypothetical protein [Bacteroides fragilis]
MAEKIETKQKDKSREEYLLILDAFRRMVYNYENSAERWEVFYDIVTLRASFLIDRALTGLRIDFDRALEILRNTNSNLTAREETERDTLLAAIDNLIDFAAAEETAFMSELPEELDLKDMEIYEDTCRKYNETYADVENNQVLHAAAIAAWWIGTSSETIITFNTQGDERVRPWHLSFEGVSYLKSEFPPELIPPIEWGCRCFLTANGFGSVYGSAIKPDYKGKVNPVFAESLATGGRIFSPAHPYFSETLPEEAKKIKQRIKAKFNIPCLQ